MDNDAIATPTFVMSFDKLGWLNFRAFFLTLIGETVKMKICTVQGLSNSTALSFGSPALMSYAGGIVSLQSLQTEASIQDLLETQTEHRRREHDAERRCQREELRHILLGSPGAIRQAIHQLHVLGYAESLLWSPVAAVTNSVIITPAQGAAISLLRRSV